MRIVIVTIIMLIAIAANGYARVRPAGTAVRVTTEFAVDSELAREIFARKV